MLVPLHNDLVPLTTSATAPMVPNPPLLPLPRNLPQHPMAAGAGVTVGAVSLRFPSTRALRLQTCAICPSSPLSFFVPPTCPFAWLHFFLIFIFCDCFALCVICRFPASTFPSLKLCRLPRSTQRPFKHRTLRFSPGVTQAAFVAIANARLAATGAAHSAACWRLFLKRRPQQGASTSEVPKVILQIASGSPSFLQLNRLPG